MANQYLTIANTYHTTSLGISDVVFGVVGFGGVGINGQVHAKTINGKLTASGAEVIIYRRSSSSGQQRSCNVLLMYMYD